MEYRLGHDIDDRRLAELEKDRNDAFSNHQLLEEHLGRM